MRILVRAFGISDGRELSTGLDRDFPRLALHILRMVASCSRSSVAV